MKAASEALLAKEQMREGTTVATAAAALFKAVVGTGIFALPPAIRASGIVLGSAMSVLMGMVSLYTTWAMLECVRELRRRGHAKDNDGRIEYTDVTALYSPRWESIVTVLCVVGQLGSALGFFAFICDSVQPLIGLSPAHVYAAIALLEVPLVLLRDTSHPAFEAAMTFGNVAVALALGTVIWGTLYAPSADYPHPDPSELQLADSGGLGLLFGVTLIMFSCHLEAVSIEQDMAQREHFDWVVNATFLVLVLVFLGFGLLVYASLGEATGRVHADANVSGGWVEATIMSNLEDGAFVITVKLLMSLNLVLMMPITLLPASRALEALWAPCLGTSSWAHALLRLSMLVGLAVAAALFPSFEAIVGITGALGGATCFTLPALCYAHFCCGEIPCRRGLAHAVAVFGLAGTAWSFVQQVAPQ